MFDCTSFVFLLLARQSPSAVFGSQGKRFFTSFRMTKGLDSGRAGPGERFAVAIIRLLEPCGPQPPAAEARKRAPQAAPDIPYEVTALTIAVKPLFAPSAAFLRAIALQRLLRATASSGREPWTTSAVAAMRGLLRPMRRGIRTVPGCVSVRTWRTRCPTTTVRAAFPCAASKHLQLFLRTGEERFVFRDAGASGVMLPPIDRSACEVRRNIVRRRGKHSSVMMPGSRERASSGARTAATEVGRGNES